MDKGGEQTPVGGIDLGGRTVSEEKFPFVRQNKEWRGWSYSSLASQPAAKLVFGRFLAIHQKGASLFLRLGGGDDVTAFVGGSGKPVLGQLVSFGGNFLNFKSRAKRRKRRGGGGRGLGVLCSSPLAGSRAISCDMCSPRRERERLRSADALTYKLDRLVEPGADVSFVVVLDGDALVEEGVLEVVGAIGRDVDQGSDPQHVEHVFPRSMVSAAKVQERQDLHRTPLGKEKKKERKTLSKLQLGATTNGKMSSK